MADNTVINAGAGGDTIATDDIAGIKHQRVKIQHGADGSATDVSSASPLPVNPLGFETTINQTVTRPADTATYAIGDAWADSTSTPTAGGFTFTGAGRVSGGSGIILDAVVAVSAGVTASLNGQIFIFDSAVTTAPADNAEFALDDADMAKLVGYFDFTILNVDPTSPANGLYHAKNLNIAYTCVGTANLRFLVRVNNAYVPTSAEILTVRIKCLQVN